MVLQDKKKETEAGVIVDPQLAPDKSARFKKQIEFILEADALKRVQRQTVLLDRSRRENSSEHSWHIALMVMIFSEYSRERDIDLLRVMKMLLVHDLVEIDAGDTYCYDDEGRQDQARREAAGADRIFGLLPEDQAIELRALWREFEERQTAESKFAHALDRVQPLLNNYFTAGLTWQENQINSDQVHRRMRPAKDGAPILWNYVSTLIEDAVDKGFLAK